MNGTINAEVLIELYKRELAELNHTKLMLQAQVLTLQKELAEKSAPDED